MSDTPREDLTDLISAHVPEFLDEGRVRCSGCLVGVDAEPAAFSTYWGFALHLVDLTAADWLVIPRSDITGTEYGWRTVGRGVMKVDSRDEAIETARGIRELRRGRGEPHGVEAVECPTLPWSVIRLPEDGTA